VAEEVAKDLQEGDMLITLGAGDVTRLGPEIVEALRKREQDRT
jgi:UDP-N-acetylmuramate--alanine ligase